MDLELFFDHRMAKVALAEVSYLTISVVDEDCLCPNRTSVFTVNSHVEVGVLSKSPSSVAQRLRNTTELTVFPRRVSDQPVVLPHAELEITGFWNSLQP